LLTRSTQTPMKYKLKAEKANEAQTQQAATELDQSRRHRDDPLRRFRPESPTVYDTSGSANGRRTGLSA
jgi:hypothetical protein